jgi:glycosyltransferase involved in cell wall biosynthesis
VKVAMHVDGPAIRGNERQALLIASGLVERGHEVVVSCRAGGVVQREMEARGTRTTGVRPRGDADLWNLLRFAAWLRRERPDALLLTSWVRAFGASLAGRAAGVPRIVLRVGGPQTVPGGPSGWKYRRALLAQIEALVVNSTALAERFRRQLASLDDRRLHVVPNALESPPDVTATLRSEIGAEPGDFLVLGVGALERQKGFDLLLDAVSRLTDRSVRVVIAGEGPERKRLTEQTREAGLSGRVHLLGARADVPALLAAADAFALSSRSDSMANAMLEAMAAGLPVIATDVPGSSDALEAREGRPPAGWMVPRDDAVALASALRRVAEGLRAGDPSVAVRAGEARWRIAHWFTVERMVSGYESVLRGA